MKKIKTNLGKEIMYDEESEDIISRFHWSVFKDTNTFYANSHYYDEGNIRRSVQLHRLITGAKPGEIVDHIDGNGLNNQKNNLRIVDSSMNSINRNNKRKGSFLSKYIGVSWSISNRKWVARIKSKRCRWVAYFDKERDAGSAYLKKRNELLSFGVSH